MRNEIQPDVPVAPIQRPESMVWHLIAALILLATATLGCHSNGGGAAPAPSVVPVPTPAASMAALDRAPQAVRDAFAKESPEAKVSKMRHRMHPDGMVHYTIWSTDKKGVAHEDEYRADGVKLSSR